MLEAPANDDTPTAPRQQADVFSYFLGVDPGAGGGLALLDRQRRPHWISAMPPTLEELWRLLESLPPRTYAVVEQVGGYLKGSESRGASGGAANGSAMFKFGASYGALLMGLTALATKGVRYRTVPPAVWQKGLLISGRALPPRGAAGTGRETRTQFKARLKAAALTLFPREKVTLKTADALLIAAYAYRWFYNQKVY